MHVPEEFPLLRASAAAAAAVSHPMPTADLASARTLLAGAVALVALAVLFLPFGPPVAIAAVGPGALALVLGIAGAALLPGARRVREAVDRMRAGEYLFLWSYDADLWQPFVERERRRTGRAVPLVAALCGGGGLLAGALILADGDRFFGSGALTLALPALVLGAFGALLAAVLVRASRHVFSLAREYPGLAVLGPGGIYLTGQYRPWRRFGQSFMEAASDPGPPRALLVKFIVSGGRSSAVQTLRVPVPPGEEPLALEAVAYLNRR